MATQNLELAGPIKRTIKGHENWYYGGGEEAYQDRASALASVPVPVRIGQTVGIYESGKIVEYWWRELTTDEGLVLKMEAGGTSYTLPIATSTTLGGLKVGSTLSIDSTTGVLDVIPNLTRFGIEDNTGLQNRSIDMNAFNFDINTQGDFNFILDGLPIDDTNASVTISGANKSFNAYLEDSVSNTYGSFGVGTGYLSGNSYNMTTHKGASFQVTSEGTSQMASSNEVTIQDSYVTVTPNLIELGTKYQSTPGAYIRARLDSGNAPIVYLYAQNTPNNKETKFTVEEDKAYITIGDLSNKQVFSTPTISTEHFIPLSVNGTFADSTGNITLDLGSGGGGGTALSLTTTGTSGAATYNSGTGVLNIPDYTYTLPIASASVLGGIKVGSGLSIDGTGVLSSTGLRFGVEDNTATSSRSFNTAGNVFAFSGSNTSSIITVNNTGASGTGVTSAGNNVGIRATSSSIGLWATGNNWGIIGESPSSATGMGIAGVSYNDVGPAIRGSVVRTSGNNITNVLELIRGTSGTPANFIGGAIAFSSDVTGASGYQCGRLIHRVIDVTNTNVTTRFELEVYNAGVAQISFTFRDNGTLNVPRTKEFADNATAIAGGLSVGDIYRTGDILKMVHS